HVFQSGVVPRAIRLRRRPFSLVLGPHVGMAHALGMDPSRLPGGPDDGCLLPERSSSDSGPHRIAIRPVERGPRESFSRSPSPFPPATLRQARHGLSELGRRRVLLRDLKLSLLARDGFVRESLLYLAYASLRFRPGALPSARRGTLPLGALGICFSLGVPASL